jgi:hypothetical protein
VFRVRCLHCPPERALLLRTLAISERDVRLLRDHLTIVHPDERHPPKDDLNTLLRQYHLEQRGGSGER